MPHTLSILRQVRPPIMPYTAKRVRALLAHPPSTNAQLEEVLLCDPAATLSLYRAVARLRRDTVDELTGPAHAVALIGRAAFRQRFDQLPVLEAMPDDPILSPAFAYSQAAHAGWYAEQIGRAMGFRHPVEMRVAALLQHPAVLALWISDPEAAAQATRAVREGTSLHTAFSAALRHPLEAIDRQLALEWDLPRLARELAGDWDAANRLPRSVALAVRLAAVAAAGWPPEDSRQLAATLAEQLPHHRNATAWWHGQTAAAARMLAPFGYPLPARELILLPTGEAATEATPPVRSRRLPSGEADGRPQNPASLSVLLVHALQDLQRQSQTKRALLVLADRQRHALQTRVATGWAPDHPVRGLSLPTREKHL
ncbi:MAG: HDOD domain-containing protein, partial [Gammaproteobacteria bacterium]